jgi:hypothetical protein
MYVYIYIYTHTHTYVYIYIYMCVGEEGRKGERKDASKQAPPPLRSITFVVVLELGGLDVLGGITDQQDVLVGDDVVGGENALRVGAIVFA